MKPNKQIPPAKPVATAPVAVEQVAAVETVAIVEDLPEALDLRELDLGDPATQATISKHWPRLDSHVRELWSTWRDNKARVCTQCGHVVVAVTGVCSAEPEHKYRSYADGYAASRIVFQ